MFFKDTQLIALPKIAVIGCDCSTATEPVAEINHYWNITHVSIIFNKFHVVIAENAKILFAP